MVKTQQTARKSTGGKVRAKDLKAKAARTRSATKNAGHVVKKRRFKPGSKSGYYNVYYSKTDNL